MSEKNAQSVLRCTECNKPFDKESTLKRHGYYCRSRGVSHTPRPRSCHFCAKTKTRCDKKWPKCSRCTAKGIECQYGSKLPKFQKSDVQDGNSLNLSNYQADLNRDTIRHDELVVVDQEITELEREYLNWDVPDYNYAEFSNVHTSQTNLYPWTGSPLVSQVSPPIDQEFQINLPIATNWSMPAFPTPKPHSLIKRPKINAGIERTAKLILHTLKSYVFTMLRHNSLPPFIHPSLVHSEFSMEPLINCINLVHMISGEMKGNRKLFWRNVRMECERLCDEGPTLSKWELLAAMQALAIYIIIRLDDGETEYNGFDSLLIAAVTVVAQKLTENDIAGNFSLDGSWEDWLFEESRRRLSVVYKVFNMLFYFEPAAMCNLPTDLVLAPLPAKKQLWEASNEAVWKSESQREGEVQVEFGLTGSGDLVKLGENHSGTALVHTSITANTPARTTASWEEWCEGMDGFGGLVMLAASMVV